TLIVALIGAALQITTLRPLLGRDPLTTILATFGISLVMQNYALWQFGPVARKIPEPFSGQFTLFYLEYPWYRVLIAVLSAAIIGGFYLFLKYGTYGIWIRATTQHRVMAEAMGIPVSWVHTAVYGIGAGMAAASGVLFGPLVGVNHAMGVDWIGFSIILALLIVAPLVLTEFWRRCLTEILVWGLLAMSSDILIGYTGMVSFGHSAFFGLGMYGAAAALLMVRPPNLWLAIL